MRLVQRPKMISRATFLAALLLSIVAHAEAPSTTIPLIPRTAPSAGQPTAESPPTTWYGWQTIIADSASAVVTTVAALSLHNASQTGPTLLAMSGIAGYLFAPSVVHVAHGRVITGVADLGLRLATPVVTSLVLYGLGPPCSTIENDYNDRKCVPYALTGLVVGAFAASAIDAVGLAQEPAPQRAAAGTDFTVAPMIAHNQAGLSVFGSF